MSKGQDRRRGFGLVALVFGLSAYACGGEGPKTGAALRGEVSGVAADDRSRCDFKGRSDRSASLEIADIDIHREGLFCRIAGIESGNGCFTQASSRAARA